MRKRTEIAVTIVMVIIAATALLAYFNYGSGTIEIKISDPPTDWGKATQVYLNYSAIEIHRAQAPNESGWFTIVEKSAWINLTRTLDINQTVGHANLQAGFYNLIRFGILNARVTVGNYNYTTWFPSGKLTIAITRGGIQINTGQAVSLLIDVNVRVESETAGTFRLVPTVRAIPT